MLNRFFKKIISLCMAFLVLASTMSFTVNKHYCGEDLIATSWFTKADTCCMEGMQIPSSKEESILIDSCCNNVVTIINGQKEIQQTSLEKTIKQQLFIITFVYTYSNLFSAKESSVVSYKNYIPPILVKDIHVLDAVFLI